MARKREVVASPSNFGEELAWLCDHVGVEQTELDAHLKSQEEHFAELKIRAGGTDYTRNLEKGRSPPPERAVVDAIVEFLRAGARADDTDFHHRALELWTRFAAPGRLKWREPDVWEWHLAEQKRLGARLTLADASLLATLHAFPEPDPEIPARRGLDDQFRWGEPVEHDGRSAADRMTEVLRLAREDPYAVQALHTILDILACRDFPGGARRRMLVMVARHLDEAQDRYQEGTALGPSKSKVVKNTLVIKDGEWHQVVGAAKVVEQTTDWAGEVVDEQLLDQDEGIP